MGIDPGLTRMGFGVVDEEGSRLTGLACDTIATSPGDSVARRLDVVYEALSAGRLSPLADLPIQYGDFAVWQNQRLQDRGLDRRGGRTGIDHENELAIFVRSPHPRRDGHEVARAVEREHDHISSSNCLS